MRRQDKQRAKEKRKSFLFLLLLLLLRESVLCVSVRACSHLKCLFCEDKNAPERDKSL